MDWMITIVANAQLVHIYVTVLRWVKRSHGRFSLAFDLTQSTVLSFHLHSPSCQTMFRVSRGIIGELAEFPTEPLEVPSTSASLPTSPSPSNLTRASDSASSRSENLSMSSKGVQLANNEARDTQYFRRFHVIVTPPSNSPPITMSESTPVLELILCHKPSDLPSFAWTELYQHEVDANVILPILNKCLKKEKEGIMAQDHFWIVTFVRTPVYSVKLILACTDGVTGKYPVFLFTPIPYVAMEDDAYLYQSLFSAVRHLQTAVPTHRIYSVFGRVMLARMFAIIWTQQTNIPVISDAYYHCKITYLTCATFELKKSELPSIPMAQIRPAELRDWEGVARLCYYFADRLVLHLSCSTFLYLPFCIAPIHPDGRSSPCRSPRAH